MGAGRAGTCTLLGPEGPDAAPVFGVAGFLQALADAHCGGRVWGCCSSVENYIVDASILD